MAYVTGKNGSFEIAGSPFSARITWKETYDISKNASKVSIESVEVKSSSWYGYGYYPSGTISVNGETVASFSSGSGTHYVSIKKTNTYYAIEPTGTTGTPPWVSGEITHNTDGKKSIAIGVSFGLYTTSGNGGSGNKITGTNTVALTDIPRYATITAAPNFNDEQNPTITYSNPAGSIATSLRACITLDGTVADIEYRDVSKTGSSYTFNLTDAERDVLRAATTGGNSRSVGFYLRTEIGGSVDASKVWRTLTIKNPNPTIDPTVTDTNSKTVALTGDSSKLVRYCSNAHVIIDAQAVKKATLTSQKVTCGNKSLNGDGTIEAVESGTFVFTATDSRGNTTQKTINPAFVEYVKLSCILGNSQPDAGGNMTVKVSGSYFDGSFGAANNSLAVYYRYKVSGGSYGSWQPMTVAIGSSANYTATASLKGLDYQTQYVFQAYAADKLTTVNSVEKAVKAAPIFDWGESDFKFNVPVYDQFGSKFGNGLAAYIGSGDSGIDPDTTIEPLILTMVNTPISGQFMYIHTVFYNTKSATSNRAQFAIPYKSKGNMYHRYYVSGAWSEWEKHINESDILNAVYPVGSYYIANHSTSPAELFGGTWHRIEGRMLYGCDSTGTIGATGGSWSHTHTLGESAHAQINHHDGAFWFKEVEGVSFTATGKGSSAGAVVSTAQTAGIPLSGATDSSSNMPPYVNVAIWRRTA